MASIPATGKYHLQNTNPFSTTHAIIELLQFTFLFPSHRFFFDPTSNPVTNNITLPAMQLFAVGLLALAVPAVFSASLGAAPGIQPLFPVASACPKVSCENRMPEVQEILEIVKTANTDCETLKAAMKSFVRDHLSLTGAQANSGETTPNLAGFAEYLRETLTPQVDKTIIAPSTENQAPKLFRRDDDDDDAGASDDCAACCPSDNPVQNLLCCPCFCMSAALNEIGKGISDCFSCFCTTFNPCFWECCDKTESSE
ncbi:hypothetical protein BJ085DRAFT_29326 [Dimargaris cristalligena]|uniref:Uncharacterized protein n=1 Tax=Dimargaris cristalligena TaxID=215637 RepID=A0A4P9ZU49_9FUNG|nr:hypothetical protein BJ085DRAFT_29326 [Dimargaris cristalligena]|eukprot:RKP37073.1 hypothetical protein BJ085DRAFT_29326 [Dimargaris cristalligena]